MTTKTSASAVEVFKVFLRLGLTSFGGPTAHIGYFRKEIIERRGWMTENQFSQILAICQFLPGPASSQLGFALGLFRAGWLGAICAFVAFTLPSVLLLVGFIAALPVVSEQTSNNAIHGLKLVACAVVADAVWGMSKKLCPDNVRRGFALFAAAIILISPFAGAQIAVVLLGAVAGVFLCRQNTQVETDFLKVQYGKGLGWLLLSVFIMLFLLLTLAPDSSLLAIAKAFYQTGALVFGGGHVVLPLLEQSVVANGWVSNESFLAGYGAAQALPGPLFAFAAYLGALIPSEHSSLLVAVVALLFIFLPGFLLLGAVLPFWQSVSHNRHAVNAITGINAVVVGILFAALIDPILISGIASMFDIIVAFIALIMLVKWQLSPLWVVFWCVGASVVGFLTFS